MSLQQRLFACSRWFAADWVEIPGSPSDLPGKNQQVARNGRFAIEFWKIDDYRIGIDYVHIAPNGFIYGALSSLCQPFSMHWLGL